ncbi:hypothetical protein ACR6HW_05545 [Fusibacter sp. JL298sf-3]
MGKYSGLWVLLTLVIGIVLFKAVSFVSVVLLANVGHNFDTLLLMACTSSILSTTIVCTKIIVDKLKAQSNQQ